MIMILLLLGDETTTIGVKEANQTLPKATVPIGVAPKIIPKRYYT